MGERIREWALVPANAGTCLNDDSAWLMAFMNALHSHLPEDERPTAWMDFSDDQRARIRSAYRAMISVAATLDPPASQVEGGDE